MTSIVKSVLKTYLIDSNEALEFKLVREPSDVQDEEATFRPDMSHQVFGDSEQIYGYIGLQIKLYYSACKLTTYLVYDYEEKVDPARFEGIEPDEIIKPIAERIPPGYLTNIDDFVSSLEKEGNFEPFGEMAHRFTVETDAGEVKVFELYSHDISPPGFLEYHERLQTFLLWYIDASSYIDTDDERWQYFLLYEKFMVNGRAHFAVAGYTTVYEYYAYPLNTRPRISQMLIMPPFQRMGLGAEMLQKLYDHYAKIPKVLDITVEDPSENFQHLRDFVDSRNCLKLKCFAPQNLWQGFRPEMAEEAQKTLKLSKLQSRRVYEILRLGVTNRHSNKDYKAYRLCVKNRLNVQFKKEDNYIKKLSKVLSASEFTATMSITTPEQRIETLDRLYKDIEEQYDHVVTKLSNEGLLYTN